MDKLSGIRLNKSLAADISESGLQKLWRRYGKPRLEGNALFGGGPAKNDILWWPKAHAGANYINMPNNGLVGSLGDTAIPAPMINPFPKTLKVSAKHKSTDGFIGLKVHPEDGKKLIKILDDSGITGGIPNDALHMTVMYDDSNPSTEYSPKDTTYPSTITGVDQYGDAGSEWEAIVLKFSNPDIAKREGELRALGFTAGYPTFKQHVSIKYRPNKGDLEKLKAALPKIKEVLPTIRLCKEYSEPLTDEPKQTLKDKVTADIETKVAEKLSMYIRYVSR